MIVVMELFDYWQVRRFCKLLVRKLTFYESDTKKRQSVFRSFLFYIETEAKDSNHYKPLQILLSSSDTFDKNINMHQQTWIFEKRLQHFQNVPTNMLV